MSAASLAERSVSRGSAVLGLLALPTLMGCSTVVRGPNETLFVHISPLPAELIITQNGNESGSQTKTCASSPCEVSLSRRADILVTASADGYQPISFRVISSRMTSNVATPDGVVIAGSPHGSLVVAGDPSFAAKVPTGGASLFGGILTLGTGLVIDQASGSNRSLSPNPVNVVLSADGTGEDK